MPSTAEQNIQFCHSFYSSKDLILSKYPYTCNGDGSKTVTLKEDATGYIKLIFDNDQIILQSSEKCLRVEDPDVRVKKVWEITFSINSIFINYQSREEYDDSIHENNFFIHILENDMVKANAHGYSGGTVKHKYDGPMNDADRKYILNLLVKKLESMMPAKVYIQEADQLIQAWIYTFFSNKNAPTPVVDIINSYAI